MSAIWLRARALLRHGWRATLAFAIVLGVLAGGVIAAAAAARRTASAFDRFLASSRGAHVVIPNYETTASFSEETVAAQDGIAAVARFRFAAMYVPLKERPSWYPDDAPATDYANLISYEDDPFTAAVERPTLLRGRRPQPGRLDEVLMTPRGAGRFGFDVGDSFLPTTDAEIVRTIGEFVPGMVRLLAHPPRFRVVGVALSAGTFPPQVDSESIDMIMTPAFYERVGRASYQTDEGLFVRLTDEGLAAEFISALGAGADRFVYVDDRTAANQDLARTLRIRAIPLWIVAGLAGLVLALVLAQVVARRERRATAEHLSLRALGAVPAEIAAGEAVRGGVIGLLAAVPAVAVAFALSDLSPSGPARLAESAPGSTLDLGAIGPGVAILVALVAGMHAVPAWRVARRGDRPDPSRGSSIADLAARAGLPMTTTTGLRLALEPQTLGRATRVTVAGLVLGLTAAIASVVFGDSLARLAGDPRLAGVTWDVSIQSDEEDLAAIADEIAAAPFVEGLGLVWAGFPADVKGDGPARSMIVVSIETVEGGVGPVVIDGRAPRPTGRRPFEAVIGVRSLEALGLRIGDEVRVGVPGEKVDLRAVVVGTAIVPGGLKVGEGLMLSPEGGRALTPAEGLSSGILVDLADGATRDDIMGFLAKRVEDFYESPIASAGELAATTESRGLNNVLVVLLAAISIATLAYGVTSAVQARRKDLALLTALGFERRQIRKAVAVHATFLTVGSLIIAIPLGVLAGRWAWRLLAGSLGLGAGPVSSVPTLLVVAGAAVLVANLVAAIPARAAARTRPAVVLREE
jgi:ABC-type lipoprotein release transport system permease subunit